MPPLIEDIGLVPYSTAKQMAKIFNKPTVARTFTADIIDGLKDAMVASNWTLNSTTRAKATISYPTGFPFFAGTVTGDCGCSAVSVIIRTLAGDFTFCPCAAGSTLSGATCNQFYLGTNPFDSLTNLATAISLKSPYIATLVLTSGGFYVIELEAKIAGPQPNYNRVIADGRFGVSSGLTVGGGYILESTASSDYTVTIGGGLGVAEEQGVQFDCLIGPSGSEGTASYYLGTSGVGSYIIAADPSAFAILDAVSALHSFACFSPQIDTAQGFTAAYAVAVIGPNNLTTQLMWEGFSSPTSVSLDGPPWTGGDIKAGPGVLCLRSYAGGIPLVGLDGRPLATAAYLFMGQGPGGTGAAVGKLWDCIVLNDFLVVGSTYQNLGRSYLVIAANDGAGGRSRGSLLFCINDNGL